MAGGDWGWGFVNWPKSPMVLLMQKKLNRDKQTSSENELSASEKGKGTDSFA